MYKFRGISLLGFVLIRKCQKKKQTQLVFSIHVQFFVRFGGICERDLIVSTKSTNSKSTSLGFYSILFLSCVSSVWILSPWIRILIHVALFFNDWGNSRQHVFFCARVSDPISPRTFLRLRLLKRYTHGFLCSCFWPYTKHLFYRSNYFTLTNPLLLLFYLKLSFLEHLIMWWKLNMIW